MSKDFNKSFKNQFPGSEKDKDGKAIKFESQDSNYRVYYPSYKTVDNKTGYKLKMDLDHIRGGSQRDDHGKVTLLTENDGTVTSYKHDVELADNGIKSVIEIAAKASGMYFKVTEVIAPIVAGCVAAAITVEASPVAQAAAGGIASAVTSGIVKIEAKMVSMVFTAFGALSDKLQDLSDGGGRDYFPMVITHSSLRCHNSQMIDLQKKEMPSLLNFDFKNFKKEIEDDDDTKHVEKSKGGEAIDFEYNKNKYRVWKQDMTLSYTNSHMILSCKVDGIRNNKQDDHLLMIAAYDCNKNLVMVRATITMENEDTQSLPAIVLTEDGNVIEVGDDSKKTDTHQNEVRYGLESQIKKALKDMKHYDDFSKQRKGLSEVARDLLRWMQNSITS
jgi:hypothetical protein